MNTAPWYVAGPILGLAIVALRAALNKPYGVLGGYIDLAENGPRPRRLGLGAYVLFGIVVGAAAYAATFGSFGLSLTYASGGLLPDSPGLQFVLLLLAGAAMGFGARAAGGCTSGHGLTGVSLGSPASFVACATFFAVAVTLAHLVAWL